MSSELFNHMFDLLVDPLYFCHFIVVPCYERVNYCKSMYLTVLNLEKQMCSTCMSTFYNVEEKKTVHGGDNDKGLRGVLWGDSGA